MRRRTVVSGHLLASAQDNGAARTFLRRHSLERLGGMVRERMQAEPRSKALFVFVGKRGHTMKVLTWDGTGAIVVHKKLDAGKFELPKATRVDDQHVIVSDAIFEVIYKGVAIAPKKPRKRIH